jgi:hypothetical protein
MRLELIKKTDAGKIRFIIERDGWPILNVSVTETKTEEEARKEAELLFQKAMNPVITETLKSVEL